MKLLLIAGYDRSLLNFRLPLIRDLQRAGVTVVACAPPEHAEVPARLQALGVRFVPVLLGRTGLNPLADWGSYQSLRAICRTEQPDMVLSYTIKPVIYGSLAAKACGVPEIYALITGLGTAFNTTGVKGWLIKSVAILLYRNGLRGCRHVFVQNGEIEELFIAKRIAHPQQLLRVAGSGVDTEHYTPQPLPVRPLFLYLGRLLRDKGLVEFAAAAAEVRRRDPGVRCRIVGGIDSNPTGIPEAEISRWVADGWLERLGHCEDVRPHLAECTVYVLPSYHEGMPRSVLEAMSMGRAIITTDVIGCRETVLLPPGATPDANGLLWGENGILVPARSAQALAEAMTHLARDPERVARMGRRSREIAVDIFDVRAVNRKMLAAMGLPSPKTFEVGA